MRVSAKEKRLTNILTIKIIFMLNVGATGFEPVNLFYVKKALYQLSYAPIFSLKISNNVSPIYKTLLCRAISK